MTDHKNSQFSNSFLSWIHWHNSGQITIFRSEWSTPQAEKIASKFVATLVAKSDPLPTKSQCGLEQALLHVSKQL